MLVGWLLLVTQLVECFASVGTDRLSGLTSSLLICLLEEPCGCLQTRRPSVRFFVSLCWLLNGCEPRGKTLNLCLSGNCSALLRCRLRQSVEPYLEPRWLPAAWEEFAVAPRCGGPREGLLKNSACYSVLTAVCRVGDQLDSQSEAQTGSSGEEVQRETYV